MIAAGAPAYDGPTSLSRPHRIGPADDELPQHRRPVGHPRRRGRGDGGNHESLSPYLTGGGALFVLLLLLWITTRFNRDR